MEDHKFFVMIKKFPRYITYVPLLGAEYRRMIKIISNALTIEDFFLIMKGELKRAEQQKISPVYDPNPCNEIPGLQEIKDKSDLFWEVTEKFLIKQDYTDLPLLINDLDFKPYVDWVFKNDLL